MGGRLEMRKMKKFKVYTYYYPERKLCLAYTRYHPPTPGLKVYEVEATIGINAKKIAIKLRKEEDEK
jgi:hypothetical protein